jgi:hypothetical protein
MNIGPLACSKPECDVATSNACILNNDPVSSCPNLLSRGEDFLDEAEGRAEAREDPTLRTDTANSVEIWRSDVLNQVELNALLRQQAPQIVALVGEQDAGKTTLLASLYGQFCRGPIGGFLFVGSKTLVGFAKRYHLALLSSGLKDIKAPRTSRNDPLADPAMHEMRPHPRGASPARPA